MSTESIVVEQDPSKLRPSDVPYIEADTAKLREDTGWDPIYSLEETLRTILDHNRRNYGLL
jgi:GDP-4-dehydro-6-deoxy-D-mannose reductase